MLVTRSLRSPSIPDATYITQLERNALTFETMIGSTPNDRGCWLKGPGSNYSITTDYEKFIPKGITRKYYLNVTQYPMNVDGVMNFDSKAFNNSYPGPWIQACWGDDIEVTVENLLNFNGTGVHWHGIRQFGTNEEDGVSGVTQCPVAPGQSYAPKYLC